MPRTDVLRSGTGTAGSNRPRRLFLCEPTRALFRPWNTPPVAAPSALSSSAFTPTDAARMPIVYWRSGPQRSNALLGMESITRCQPYLCARQSYERARGEAPHRHRVRDGELQDVGRRQIPLRLEAVASVRRLVHQSAADGDRLLKAQLPQKRGIRHEPPDERARHRGGRRARHRAHHGGRTSTDMNRTSCDEDTMPISIAMRIAAGSVVSVLNHSCITALMSVALVHLAQRRARGEKLESPSCDAFWKESRSRSGRRGDGRRSDDGHGESGDSPPRDDEKRRGRRRAEKKRRGYQRPWRVRRDVRVVRRAGASRKKQAF